MRAAAFLTLASMVTACADPAPPLPPIKPTVKVSEHARHYGMPLTPGGLGGTPQGSGLYPIRFPN